MMFVVLLEGRRGREETTVPKGARGQSLMFTPYLKEQIGTVLHPLVKEG
jgi:hypothetical protein